MQETFLDLVVKNILSLPSLDWEKCKIIFPNKRPAGYFEEALKKQNVQLPKHLNIFAIEDFVASYSSLELCDPLEQLFKLYKTHLVYKPEDTFDLFHNWGNMILRDYDEMDKYLVEPKRFFSHLGATKEIEETDIDPDLALQFWTTINRNKPTELQEQFLMHWEIFEKVYFDFNALLRSENKAYAGMIYREVAEKFVSNNINEDINQYLFIGFNALSKSEEVIIRSLQLENKAQVYFDTDSYYLNDPKEEAGYFIRKAMKNLRLTEPGICVSNLLEEEKEIQFISTSMESTQGMALHQVLKEQKPIGHSAIVLPDEGLLAPVIHAIPEDITDISFTIGNPITDSGLYSLFELLASLQVGFDPANQAFSYNDVLAVLSHPLVAIEGDAELAELIHNIENYEIINVNKQLLYKYTGKSGLSIFFNEARTVESLINYLEQIINFTKQHKSLSEETELIFRDVLNKLKALLVVNDVSVNINTFWRFFRQLCSQVKVIKNDEKQGALQVMGMLETRALSFNTVYILNVNEGNLPSGSSSHSYIPFDIRKSFGMPTFDEQESLSTYYFYRLLQWAKKIHLFYYTENGKGKVEESRYIRQLKYFLAKRNPKVNFIEKPFKIALQSNNIKKIQFNKDAAFDELLNRRETKGLSPTFISTYYACNLQFYFKYVSKLEAPNEVSEELEADRFGTLFHDIMQMMYADYIGKEVLAGDIEQMIQTIKLRIEEALKGLHWDSEYIIDKNSLIIESIAVLLRHTLALDQKHAPFYVLGLEESVSYSYVHEDGNTITLQGKIDRIDKKDNITRIVDYKTGNVVKFNFKYIEQIDELSKDNKEAFQALFYALMYYKKHQTPIIQTSLLPLKQVIKGYININADESLLQASNFIALENAIKEIIKPIFDKSLEITQTDNLKICSYCEYKKLCLR